ncbi:MAG: hypothetical protein V3U37_06575, partial [Nitrospinaceae bacterium]
TSGNNVFDVFKVQGSSGELIEYSNFFFLQKQIKEDMRRVFVDKEPVASIYKGRTLVPPAEKRPYKDVKLKIKVIGRAVKLETRNLFGIFMMETRVFSKFNMEIQRAVVHSHQDSASNIFYLRPQDVARIMENEDHFNNVLTSALQDLIEPRSVLLEEPIEVN